MNDWRERAIEISGRGLTNPHLLLISGPANSVGAWLHENRAIILEDAESILCVVEDFTISKKITLEEWIDGRIYNRSGPSVHCFCGKPLHYTSKVNQERIAHFCKMLGEYVKVFYDGTFFNVPRHYIALHGIEGADLVHLGFEKA